MNERSLAVDVAYVGLGVPANGRPASTYKRFPIIHESSVAFNFNEATQISFKAMGQKDPWAVINKAGDPSSIEFAIPSPTADEMQYFCGGTVDNDGKWNEPIDTPTITKSLKIQTAVFKGRYTEYTIVNGSISARLSQAPSEEVTDLLLVKVTKEAAYDANGKQYPAFSRQVKAIETTKVTAITITGTPKVGVRLVAGTTPEGATGTYQWLKKKGTEEIVPIADVDVNSYTPQAEDVGFKISVKFTGTGYFSETVTSAETTAVTA